VHHCAHTLLFLLPIGARPGTESLPFCVCGAALSRALPPPRYAKISLGSCLCLGMLLRCAIRVDNTFCSVMQDQPLEG